jgi:hypothetical protein
MAAEVISQVRRLLSTLASAVASLMENFLKLSGTEISSGF